FLPRHTPRAPLFPYTTLFRSMLLHHATDKGWEAKSSPWSPPSRDQVKGGLSEKPELTLSVALDPHTYAFNVAVIKQRMGRSDPSAQTFQTLRCYPELTRFGPYEGVSNQRSEEHTSELQSRENLVCRLLLEKKKRTTSEPMHELIRRLT